MTDDYKTKLEEGLVFQDVVSQQLVMLKSITLTPLTSHIGQLQKGETLQGFEIKYDRLFRETKNLYIEYAEKSDPKNMSYVPSGILRNDNTWMYCVGDYEGLYLMQKKVLLMLKESNSVEHKQTSTSKGFVLPIKIAEKYFDYIEFIKPTQQKFEFEY